MQKRLLVLGVVLVLLAWLGITWGIPKYQQSRLAKQERLERIVNDPGASAEARAEAHRALGSSAAARKAAAIEENAATPYELRTPPQPNLAATPQDLHEACLQTRERILETQESTRTALAIDPRPKQESERDPAAEQRELEALQHMLDQLAEDRAWLDQHCNG